jgi:hypothetical protein
MPSRLSVSSVCLIITIDALLKPNRRSRNTYTRQEVHVHTEIECASSFEIMEG